MADSCSGCFVRRRSAPWIGGVIENYEENGVGAPDDVVEEGSERDAGLVQRLTMRVEPTVVHTRPKSDVDKARIVQQRHHAFETLRQWRAAGGLSGSFRICSGSRGSQDVVSPVESGGVDYRDEDGDGADDDDDDDEADEEMKEDVKAADVDLNPVVLNRRGSRMALHRRMSRISKDKRMEIIRNIESKSREDFEYRHGSDLDRKAINLNQRLRLLDMMSVEMCGDGNCQFRAMAHQVYRDAERHSETRRTAVEHMRENEEFFSMFFETSKDFKLYLKDMGRNRTWGDELTLRAMVEAYGCIAHVIISTPENWYLVYKPESSPPTAIAAGKDVFLTYISPIHYNAIVSRE